jgi:two-component system, OmpR family, sensor histidine kinase ArlS
MNIKSKLSIQFTLLVFGILIFFSILVYYFSYSSQKTEFNETLLRRAKNTAILLIDIQEIDSDLLGKINKTTMLLEKEEIAIYDSSKNLIYSNNLHYLKENNPINNPESQNPLFFTIKDKDGVKYKYKGDNRFYTVFVLAHDKFRVENQDRLRTVLLWCILFGIYLSITISYFFSKFAIMPISKMIAELKKINLSKISNRLDEGKGKDELEQLALSFNQMLSALEVSFKSQEEFISNASHELRTPLAVMIAGSEYILSRDRTKEDYIQQISEISSTLRNFNVLLNSLLELAYLNPENSISFSGIRIDEIVFNSIKAIKNKYPGRKIIPKIQYTENENEYLIKGNSGLLEIAFRNIIDNACKFSDKMVNVEISGEEVGLICRIRDFGMGIPASEIDSVFEPFKRAQNVAYIGGFGIGLSLVRKIIELHHARIKIESIEGETTCIEIIFKDEAKLL